MLTDAVLVDRVIAGFDDSFDELYRRYTRPVLGLALRRLHNEFSRTPDGDAAEVERRI